jgi:PhzF family phenazine biosynthesis protein
MQNMAMEMNLAETAFLLPEADGWRLRWFTPTVEVDLCGHATLASAHALWETGRLDRAQQARFYTRSGLLTADYADGWITLNFPATLPVEAEPPTGLLEALGVSQPVWTGRSLFDWLVCLIQEGSAEAVRALCPDMRALRPVEARGVIVTAQEEGGEFDFVSRFFAPASGIDEDPATGSTHCCLAPFWAERLGKAEMTGYQASARSGVIRVRLEGDRVLLMGKAVTVFRGEVCV